LISLVTGATGFVGSHVVAALIAEGTAVRALIRNPAAAQEQREAGAEVQVGDVRDPNVMREAVRDVDVVYHCAAAVGPGFSAAEIRDVGLNGVHCLLEALRQTGTGRAVLLTSVNVLGTRNLELAGEDTPCRRSGDAAADVKIEIEALAREYEQRHGLNLTILRPPLIYGPGDRHNVPQMIRALRRGKFAFIGSRDNVAPIVHVSDVVQAILLAGRTPTSRGRIYHITDGSHTTIGQFIDSLAALIGCPAPRKVLPYFVPYLGCLLFEGLARMHLYRGRPPIARSSLRHLGVSRSFSIERACKELGYRPCVSFTQGLSAAVKWIEEHTNGHTAVVSRSAG
jgi:nucleoside-diphosphate-sugar epimerase